MDLLVHLFTIPLTLAVGAWIGWALRGLLERDRAARREAATDNGPPAAANGARPETTGPPGRDPGRTK